MQQAIDTVASAKTMIFTMPADDVNHAKIPAEIRAKVESLTLAKPGTYKLIASDTADGDRVRFFFFEST